MHVCTVLWCSDAHFYGRVGLRGPHEMPPNIVNVSICVALQVYT